MLYTTNIFATVPRFVAGGTSHWVAIILGLLVLGLAIWSHRQNPQGKLAKTLHWFLVLAAFTAPLHTVLAHGITKTQPTWAHLLPLHICDLAAICAGLALLTRKPLWCLLTYYIGLGGTLQGVITPNASFAPPHPTFFAFFQLHLTVVIIAFFLPLGLRWRPQPPLWRSLLKAFLYVEGYLLTIFVINSFIGTNFAFVMGKPPNPSLFDKLGPYPFYLLPMQFLVILVLSLITLPFVFVKKNGKSTEAK